MYPVPTSAILTTTTSYPTNPFHSLCGGIGVPKLEGAKIHFWAGGVQTKRDNYAIRAPGHAIRGTLGKRSLLG